MIALRFYASGSHVTFTSMSVQTHIMHVVDTWKDLDLKVVFFFLAKLSKIITILMILCMMPVNIHC